MVNSLGRVDGDERVSRVDPCIDLVPSTPVDAGTFGGGSRGHEPRQRTGRLGIGSRAGGLA